ncbi:MAG: transposon-encoded TnpW family protein [Lachnospiraceae bacterium]
MKTTVGKITYLVGVHFSEDGKETMADKIDRMIRREIQTGTGG